MNDIAKQRICDRLVKAVKDEGITTVDAAEATGIAQAQYLSMIKNPKTWSKCPAAAWEAVLKWINSGQTIREYGAKHGNTVPPINEAPASKEKEEDTPFLPDIETRTAPLQVNNIKPDKDDQYFTDTAKLKVALDVDINLNLVINGKKVVL